jgi:hypothetical protein
LKELQKSSHENIQTNISGNEGIITLAVNYDKAPPFLSSYGMISS